MKKLLSSLVTLIMSLTSMAQVSNYSRWMAGLDDNAFVCQLSIPGAHDACASSFSGLLASIYKSLGQTQSKSVEEMLTQGIRLFDLRPCVSGEKLHINHGMATTSFDFDPVMQQLCSFVDANPTEFCIVIVRHESEGDNGNANFGNLLQSSLASIKDHLVNFRPNLTLGEARGKILFLSRNDYTLPIYGGRIVDLRDNRSNIDEMLGGHCYGPGTHKCPWWVQDYYEISDNEVKKRAILDMLTRSSALAGGYDYTWVVNYTSGYEGSTSSASAYQSNATRCNQYMQLLLASDKYKGPAGLVFMDYAVDGDNGGYYGLSLTKAIVNHNFKYVMSKRNDDIHDANGNLFVAPKGSDMMWEGKFFRKEGSNQTGPSGWYKMDFNDAGWETICFPIASEGTDAPYYSQWDGTNNIIFVRREFYIDHDPTIDTYKFYARHDDDYKVYLNGIQIDTQSGWTGDYRVVNITSNRLHVGRNVLAVQVQQKTGGAYFDCGVLHTEGRSAPVKITAGRWGTFIAPGHNIDFTGTDVKAYEITEINHNGNFPYVKAVEVDIVPSGQAVLVSSDKGEGTYRIPVTQTTASMSDNLMKAATSALNVADEGSIYCLSEQDGKSCFFPMAAGTSVAKGKGYLDLSGTDINADCIYIDCDDPTGIRTIFQDTGEAQSTTRPEGSNTYNIYNVLGQQTTRIPSTHGIYIVNGKKIVRD